MKDLYIIICFLIITACLTLLTGINNEKIKVIEDKIENLYNNQERMLTIIEKQNLIIKNYHEKDNN